MASKRSMLICSCLLLSLLGIGSSCVNDEAVVSVNVTPIVGRYKLSTDTTFGGTIAIKLDSIVSGEYANRIRQARVYDIKITVEGQYAGSVSGWVGIRIDNGPDEQLMYFPKTGTVPWSAFYAPQSLLKNSAYLAPQYHGIETLLRALTSTPLPRITLSTMCVLNVAPVPDNLYVIVEVYLQVDAEIQ